MEQNSDIELHDLETIEAALDTDREQLREGDEIASASGFLVTSASGFLVTSASGFLVT